MNSINNRAKFKHFRIILDSGFSSTTLMGRLVKNIHPEKYYVMQWHTQAVNITTINKVKIILTLPALIATIIMTRNFYVDDSATGRYNMILGLYLLT